MVAASIYLRYPKELLKGDLPEITLDQFPTFLQKAAFIAVHTRAPWVVLALIGLVTAVVAFQSRNKPKRNRLVAIAPVAVLIVMVLHAAAQGWLQSRGDLVFEFREGGSSGPQVREMPLTMPATSVATSTSTAAATGGGAIVAPSNESGRAAIEVTAIRRLYVKENQNAQWLALFGGDVLFSVPVLFAWILSLKPPGLRPAA